MAFRDYAMPSPDPLSANWSYDSAIDLFSLNTMMPESFPLDIPNDMVWDPKDFPADLFAPPPEINGFTISNHSGEDSLSSDLESDDQSFSPSNPVPTETLFPNQQVHSPLNFTTPPTPPTLDQPSPISLAPEQPTKRSPRMTTAQEKPNKIQKRTTARRWSSDSASSSPELRPEDSTTTSPSRSRKIPRSLSDDSARGRNAAKRAAHNIIEKRYRTNMNAKFVALEKAMLCGANPSTTSASTAKSSASLKKSEILSNAITYMQELQEANEKLRKEVAVLTQNLQVSSGFLR